jgi:hypothetical protein
VLWRWRVWDQRGGLIDRGCVCESFVCAVDWSREAAAVDRGERLLLLLLFTMTVRSIAVAHELASTESTAAIAKKLKRMAYDSFLL